MSALDVLRKINASRNQIEAGWSAFQAFCNSQEAWAVLQNEGLEELVSLRHAWANARDRRWEWPL